MKFAFQVRSVEPDALEGHAALTYGEFEERAAARAEQHGTAYFGNDAGSFAGLEFIETTGILAVLVAKGEVVEQVLGCADVLFGEQLGETRADATHVHCRSIEIGHRLDAKA